VAETGDRAATKETGDQQRLSKDDRKKADGGAAL
jgi:hypothetical protein